MSGMMKVNFVAALDIPEAWWLCMRDVLATGYVYANQRGSFVGERRIEFDLAVVQIKCPWKRPLIPEVPQGVPPPTTQEYVEGYLPYLMSGAKAENEEYCYSDDTEILTDAGWKKFSDLVKGKDAVATLNPETSELVYQVPDHYFDKPYSGQLKSIQSRFVDLLVTHNHRLYVAPARTERYSLREVSSIDKRVRFKRDALWIGSDMSAFTLPAVPYGNSRYAGWGVERSIPILDWLSFLGIWLAEGSLRTGKNSAVVITQNDPTRRKQILDAVRCGFPSAFEYDNDILIYDRQLVSYLLRLGRHAHEKSIPTEIMALSADKLQVLLDWMYLGDGTKKANLYSTVSKCLADQVQEICLKIGMSANIRVEKIKTGLIYRVGISKDRGLKPCVLVQDIRDVSYTGRIVCVHVPRYNILYVRRSGKPCWCGNTYGAYLEPQIDKIIQMLRDTPNTNQAYMTVGDPSTVNMDDPPCLRGIQCRVRYGALHFIIYFRSWDLYGGFPSNLAAIQMMKEYMAKEVGVADGELECISGGLHLYEHTWPYAKAVLKQKE